VINEDLSIDEATQQIIARVQQLCDVTSRDKQTLILTLQHKLKSVKERLDFKVNSDIRYMSMLITPWITVVLHFSTSGNPFLK